MVFKRNLGAIFLLINEINISNVKFVSFEILIYICSLLSGRLDLSWVILLRKMNKMHIK